MKLGINILGLFPGKIGGAEQYIRNIISTINSKKEIEVHLFVNKEASPTFNGDESLYIHEIDLMKDHSIQLNHYIEILKLDLWFCPLFHLVPINCEIPSVVAVFDIQQEYFPKNFNRKELRYRRREIAQTLEKADIILTISEYSKKTFSDKFNIDPNKIFVTYLDADGCFNQDIITEKLNIIKQSLPDNFIFYPANSWPHKNHMRLLKAYKYLKNKYNVNFKLVLTGAEKQQDKDISNFIEKNKLKNEVIYLGYIPQEDMPYIYASSKMLVFPSLFEGFGIPLVEAMKAAVPIACSTTTCIPEICGDAAVYFDPYSIIDMAEKIYKLYMDKSLRHEIVDKGKKVVNRYSWEDCCKKTVSIFNNLYTKSKDIMETDYMLPLVTIITPSYNQGVFIEETINSVLNQDYPNIEYIIMDGGSNDNTVSILRKYDGKITWKSEKDDGQADAVNKGLKLANGSIIGWLNSDDTYCENTISKIVSFFKTHPKTGMVYGEGYYTDTESNITGVYDTEIFDINRLAETCFICQPTAFIRKNILDKVDGLDKTLQLCMDYELWMKIGKVTKVSYIPEFLATSRLYNENKTLSRRSEVYSEVCRTVKKYYGYVPFSWINGYAHYLNNGRCRKRIYITILRLMIKYNYKSFSYQKRLLKYLVTKILGKIPKTEYVGQFNDGWLSKKYVGWIKNLKVSNSIYIKGENILPFEDGLSIRVLINDSLIEEFTINSCGKFEKTINLNETLPAGNHNIKLIMNKTIQPKKINMGSDSRKLSFILDEIIIL